jgi:hypothetical protein
MTRQTSADAGFVPFADEAQARTISGLSIENGRDRIAVYGSLELHRDRTGLAQARMLKETFEAIVAALEQVDLPEAIGDEAEATPRTVRNPFA